MREIEDKIMIKVLSSENNDLTTIFSGGTKINVLFIQRSALTVRIYLFCHTKTYVIFLRPETISALFLYFDCIYLQSVQKSCTFCIFFLTLILILSEFNLSFVSSIIIISNSFYNSSLRKKKERKRKNIFSL